VYLPFVDDWDTAPCTDISIIKRQNYQIVKLALGIRAPVGRFPSIRDSDFDSSFLQASPHAGISFVTVD